MGEQAHSFLCGALYYWRSRTWCEDALAWQRMEATSTGKIRYSACDRVM